MHGAFCLVFTASPNELRAKIGHYRNRCFSDISFQKYVTEGISHPVFYGDLVYKLRRVRCEENFVSSGSKIVKRLRRRKYDPLIIERNIGLVLYPSTALYGSFLAHCTLTNKAVGTIWRDLSKPPQRRQGPDPRPLWLLVRTPLVLGPEIPSGLAGHSHFCRCLYIFLIYCFYLLTCLCNNFYGLSSAFIRMIIYKYLNVCPLITRLLRLVGRLGSRKPV